MSTPTPDEAIGDLLEACSQALRVLGPSRDMRLVVLGLSGICMARASDPRSGERQELLQELGRDSGLR